MCSVQLGTGGPIWGPASSRRAQTTDTRMDPRRLWVPTEVVSFWRTVYPLRRFLTAEVIVVESLEMQPATASEDEAETVAMSRKGESMQ